MEDQSNGANINSNRTPLWGAVLYPRITDLWKSGMGCDVTLCCTDGWIQVPSVLLCAISKNMYQLLLASRDRVLTFHNISIRCWESLMELLYSGKIQFHNFEESDNSQNDIYDILLVAESLGMNQVLALYKHSALLSNQDIFIAEHLEAFQSTRPENLQVEYTSFSTDNQIELKTSILQRNLHGLKNYFRDENISTKTNVQNSKTVKLKLCCFCNKDCVARIVQCMLCNVILQNQNGIDHMNMAHIFCPASVWTYTCQVHDQGYDRRSVKGCKINHTATEEEPKHSSLPINKANNMYKCYLCDYSADILTQFMDHFLSHGFIPELCSSCGDIFSNGEDKTKHMVYCCSSVVLMNSGQTNEECVSNQDSIHEKEKVTDDFPSGTLSNHSNVWEFPVSETSVKQNKHFPKQCILCGDACITENVMCLYCNEIVPNDVSHMKIEHANSKKAVIWVFTCNIQGKTKMEMTIKSLVKEGIHTYECKKCCQIFTHKKVVLYHLRSFHRIPNVFYCEHCDCGFRTASSRSGHEHLCSGGNYIHCQRCSKLFGSKDQYEEHQILCHNSTNANGNKLTVKEVDNENTHHADVTVKLIRKEEKNLNNSGTYSMILQTNTKSKSDTKAEIGDKRNLEILTQFSMCYTCGKHCKAERVKCIYCFKIVKNDGKHMSEIHPFTPKTSMWVYSCNYLSRMKKATLTDWMLFSKLAAPGSSNYKCEKCLAVCSTLTEIKDHVKTLHQSKYVKICKVCESGFGGYMYHKDHSHFCSGGNLIKCTICDKCVGCNKALLDHMSKVHMERNKKKCDGKANITLTEVNCPRDEEVDNKNLNDNCKFQTWQSLCYGCGKACHSEKVRCIYCYKVVKNDRSHMVISHPFIPKTSSWVFTCKFPHQKLKKCNWMVCFKQYKTNFKETRESVHFGDQTKLTEHKCCKCNKTFPTVRDIKTHLKDSHKILAKICSICDTGFLKQIHLRDHYHFCNGGSLLKCEICGKILGCFKLLFSHMHKVHPEHAKTSKFSEENTEVKEEQTLVVDDTKSDTNMFIDNDKELEENRLMGNPPEMKALADNENCGLNCVKKGKLGPLIQGKRCCINLSSKDNIEEYAMHNVFTEAKTRQLGTDNPKRCFTCGDDCSADMVKCMFCHQVVSGNDFKHMTFYHPAMPKHVIWAVNCTYFDVETVSPIIAELNLVEDSEHDTGSKMYHCKLCGKYCITASDLTVHTRKCHKFSVCFCKICNAGFKYPAKRRSHEQFCSGGDLLKCVLCDKLIGNWINANSHFYGYHKQKRSSETQIKQLSMKRMSKSLSAHETSDTIKNLAEEGNGDVFMEVQRTRGNVPVKVCLICDENCTSATVKCLYCGRIVHDNAMEHMTEVHPLTPLTSIWPVKCKLFQKETVPYMIAAAIIQDDGNKMKQLMKDMSYRCDLCEKIMANQSDISKHLETDHNIKSYYCKVCGLGMRTKHFKLEHEHYCSGNDVVKCIHCNVCIGGWHNSSNHRSTYHPQVHTPNKRRRNIAKNCIVLENIEKYGYQKLCADCMGHCNAAIVKCGLCNEIVQADDIHMKLKHPYCPQTTWIVFCRYSVGTSPNHVDVIGEKVPVASKETLLKEKLIPSLLPHNYKCNQCDVVTEDLTMITNHIKFAHLENNLLFICKSCGTMIGKNRDLQHNHSQFCSKGAVFKCSVCDELYGTRKKLMYHTLINHRKETKSEKLQSMSSGKDDIKIPEGFELQCAECDFKTPLLSKLRKHNKTIHAYKICQLYQICRFCFKVFRWRSLKEKHEQHEHLGDQKVLCEICGKVFNTPLQQERHVKYFHKGGRETSSIAYMYKEKKICPHCGNIYKSTTALNKHIKVVHEQQLDYKCKTCKKGFSCRANLKVHEDRHKGLKNYSCPYCTYKAYRGNNINEHVLKHHPGKEKPYKRTTVFPQQIIRSNDGTERSHSGQHSSGHADFSQRPGEDFATGTFISQILFPSNL